MAARVAWVVGACWGVFLLCRRGQAEDQVTGLDPRGGCGTGRFLHREDHVLSCCSQCNSSIRPCPSHQLRNCTCAMPGEFCEDWNCKRCKKHTCSPGQQVLLLGKFVFGFICKDCEVGTYSNGIDGQCLPWTDCGREGFLTVRPGNRTHNVLCGMALPPGPGSGVSNSYSIPVAILTGLATITFILVIIQLVLHIWWVRKEPPTKDKESILPLGPGPPDDIGNCPFPEEEWGEETAEDKIQMGHPWV